MDLTVGHSLNNGDEVVTDADPGARYVVVAVYETKAWIRDLNGHSEMIVDHRRCAPVAQLN